MVVPSSASPPGEPSWIQIRPPDVAPSLHRHDSDFITTTSDSIPVPRIGTQVLVGAPLERLPSHRDDWFPQCHREAWTRLTPPARRTPPGQPSGHPPDFSRRYHPPSVSRGRANLSWELKRLQTLWFDEVAKRTSPHEKGAEMSSVLRSVKKRKEVPPSGRGQDRKPRGVRRVRPGCQGGRRSS